jgi:DNA modification methylase
MTHTDQLFDWLHEMDLGEPYYETRFGAAYIGDARTLMKRMPTASVDLIITSPPFALRRKKEYGNVDPEVYIEWFRPFAEEFFRILKPRASLVIDIGGTWNEGEPTKSLYQYKLLLDLVSRGFKLCQEFFWYNPARLPTPAEWVTVRRIRVKDAVDPVWWLSKSSFPRADNKKVLKDYSDSMLQLLVNGYKPALRPSGHDISAKFSRNRGGAIPSNLLTIGNTDSNSYYLKACAREGLTPHPARFPGKLPEFFIKFLSSPGAIVLDPFGGSNVTGEAAESLGRRWLCFELIENYLKGSKFRFEKPPKAHATREDRARRRFNKSVLTSISEKIQYRKDEQLA